MIDDVGNISTASTTVLTVDNTAPTNENTVFSVNLVSKGGAAVTIVSSGEVSNEVWFAPNGTSVFVAGNTMSQATNGTSTSILSPSDEGDYRIFVIDIAGNISVATTSILTVDNTAPITSAPTSDPQVLRGGVTSTSNVQSTEDGDIYLVLSSETITDLASLTTSVGNDNAFIGKVSAVFNTAYTVTPGAALNDGTYDIYAVDAVGNVSMV